ncbi:glycoside hydrolase [Bacteroides sp.]
MNANAQHVRKYRIETAKCHQTMKYFGASDAWTMQYLGLWPQEKQNQIADWLFSTENDASGQPKGIGLSLWRFNLGAGSTEQGDSSGISSPWTRTECFLQADGTYDWDKQKGQRSFLRLAKERGVKSFLAFLNSPPVYFTQNGLATNTGRGATFNLKSDCYGKHAGFIADALQGIRKQDGIKFEYICPFNEPDGTWNWTGSNQEGSPATNREIARMVRCLNDELASRRMDTKILVSESADYNYLFRIHGGENWERSCQIQSFFSPDSTDTYIGNLSNVPRLIVGHSYWTNTPLANLHDIRCTLADTLKKYNLDFWQTEVCIMSNDEEIGGGGGFDRTMKTALYVGRVIHHDIVYGGASSWQWWRAVGEDYKDGLIREYSDSPHSDGRVEDSKLMWVLGNYSRFIRPGAVRFEVSAFGENGDLIPGGDTEQKGLMCSAYKNGDGSWVMVLLNYSESERVFSFELERKKKKRIWKQYRTSDKENESLSPVGICEEGEEIVIPARSVTTFVSKK